jgi:hypothetical protein
MSFYRWESGDQFSVYVKGSFDQDRLGTKHYSSKRRPVFLQLADGGVLNHALRRLKPHSGGHGAATNAVFWLLHLISFLRAVDTDQLPRQALDSSHNERGWEKGVFHAQERISDPALLAEAATLVPELSMKRKLNPVSLTNTTVGWCDRGKTKSVQFADSYGKRSVAKTDSGQTPRKTLSEIKSGDVFSRRQAWDVWRVTFGAGATVPSGVGRTAMVQIDTISNSFTVLRCGPY